MPQRNRRRNHQRKNAAQTNNSKSSLLYGFDARRSENIKRESQNINITKLSIILPISTRAFGFATNVICNEICENEKDQSKKKSIAHALYRFSLTQFEFKLRKFNCFANLGSYAKFQYINVSDEMKWLCQGRQIFLPLLKLFNEIGLYKNKNGTQYIPRFPKCKSNLDGIDPCLVTISNLRRYVVALSDANTPQPIRLHFYKHNPIPAAKWTDDIDDPLLLNPDEIMPDNYGPNQLAEDFHLFNESARFMKTPNFVSNLKDDDEGGAGQLLSNDLLKISCDGNGTFAHTSLVSWSSENLNGFALNSSFLFGERPRPDSVEDFSIYNIRSEKFAQFRYPLSWFPGLYSFEYPAQCSGHVRKTVPISTRGIGFIIKQTSAWFDNTRSPEARNKLSNALYRIMLYILENSIDHGSIGRIPTYTHNWPVYLTNLISLISSVTSYKFGCKLNIKVPEPLKEGPLAYDPCLITFSNLEEYVNILSTKTTPRSVRDYFHQHNPLPGATWKDDDGPVLSNPEEIMPRKERDYIISHDIVFMSEVLSQRIYSGAYDSSDDDYVDERKYAHHGDEVFATPLEDIAQNEIKQAIDVFMPSCKIIDISCERISQSDSKFVEWWSMNDNGNNTLPCYLAGLYLFGEVPRLEAVDPKSTELYEVRSQEFAKIGWHCYFKPAPFRF